MNERRDENRKKNEKKKKANINEPAANKRTSGQEGHKRKEKNNDANTQIEALVWNLVESDVAGMPGYVNSPVTSN